MARRPTQPVAVRILLAATLGALLPLPAAAIERLTLTVKRIDTRIGSPGGPGHATLRDARLDLRFAPGTGMPAGRLRIGATPLGSIDLPLTLAARGSGLRLDGGPLDLPATAILGFARAPLELPTDFTAQGNLKLVFELATYGGTDLPAGARLDVLGTDLGFANGEGTYAAEGIDLDGGITLAPFTTARADTAAPMTDGMAFTAYLQSAKGEALFGNAYLKLGAHPTRLETRGTLVGDRLDIASVDLRQQGLLQANGSARIGLGSHSATGLHFESASLALQDLSVAAAYAAYVQTAVSGTVLGSLETAGRIAGNLEIRNDAAISASLELDGISLRDAEGIFFIRGLRGRLNWAADGGSAPEPSALAWDSGGTYDLSGGAASMRLLLRGRAVSLLEPARLPVFDGAVRVATLQITDLGLPSVQFRFSGGIEPISLGELSKAFGWPAFRGVLRGSIPGVAYRDGVMSFDGDLEADIFDGHIRGSNIKLGDPFGRWPRLTADFALENLDLEAITAAFEFGTITGRIEGRVDQLELFDWSPVSFDAWLRTPPGDRSRKHISVDAISNIANVGGTAGTGVAKAMNGGMLRFFSNYHYRQLAIRCVLEDDICRLSGAPLAGDRYYLLEGAGLPRVDIIGNSGRVQWSELVDQIAWQIRTGGTFRIE
jgi:hypothetical protein